MKKRLLFAFMALCTAVSGFALSVGEYVYTPQGRFQITGENVASSNFADLTGWTVVTATDKTLDNIFNTSSENGINFAQSIDATEGEGMYFKFEPTSAEATYIVSFKMKGAKTITTRVKTVAVKTNLVKIEGNSNNEFNGTEDVVVCNTAEELSEDWQTFNYAIVGDGTPRGYFISFTGMATNIQIADLQIAPAEQYADLRQREAMLEKLNVYKTCYDWKADEAGDLDDAIGTISEIVDESSQENLDDALNTANEILADFLKANMDDYLAGGSNLDYLTNTVGKQGSKQSKYGIWNCLPSGRAHWSADEYPDMGHYQNSNTWNNGAPTTPMGVYTQKELTPGSYVFAIESRAALREPKKNDWNNDDAMKPAYGVAYIVKIVDGEATDTIMSVIKDLEPVKMTPFYVTAQIKETGTYEFGIKAYCKEEYQGLKLGSVTYVGNAAIWGKNGNQYSNAQLLYEADVREQITTGRNNLTTAAEYLANADYLWGKAELQACVDTVETKIAAYELWDQDDIIATYEDYYSKSTSNEDGLMVYKVYQAGVKDIIAANKRFAAVNDTLNSIQVAIDAAEATMANRLYTTATGKDALLTAIAKAKNIQTQMKASQYSEENANIIKTANAELEEAIETFKASVPAEMFTTIADIDFSNLAVETEVEEGVKKWIIAGAVNQMILPNYTEDGTGTTYGQGLFSNGERIFADTLRVGNGTAEVVIAADQQVGGTDILKIDFDYYFGNLITKYVGFELQNSDSVAIAEFFYSPYDGKDKANTFGLNYSDTYMPKVGASGSENASIAAASNKTHFEVVLDYGTNTMYCSTVAAGGSQTTDPVQFDGSKMARFLIKSDYNNENRRSWFDNLKIQRITAGEVITDIENVKTVAKAQDNVMYNLAGQKVNKSFKGIAIKNGKKIVVK